MKERYKIVFNPTAGKGNAINSIPIIEDTFKKHKLDYNIELTKSVWDAAEISHNAALEGYTVVIAAGGDGTCNEVINGLMLSKKEGKKIPVLGVLSIGRGNDFAYGVNVPSSLDECLKVILNGKTTAMDVGRISGGNYPDGRYFGNGVGIGFDTIVGLEAAKMTHVHGFLAYVFGALRTLLIFPDAPDVVVSYSDKDIKQKSTQISIMNGRRMGGTFYMAPNAVYNDGLLNLCISESLSRFQMLKHVGLYIKGDQEKSSLIKTDVASSYTVEAQNGGLVVHADGETITIDGKYVKVECLSAQIDILTNVE